MLIATLWALTVGARAAAPTVPPSCADSWRNPAGGTWVTAKDWSTGAPPTPGQSACITIPLSAPVALSGAVSVGSLTIGGARGRDELLLNGGTLTLSAASTIARTGVLASQGYSSSVHVAGGATLVNHGKIAVASALDLSGAVTNGGDGLVAVALYLYVDTGRFTNRGRVSVQANALIQAPRPGGTGTGTGAVIANAGGTIMNLGTITVNSGATFEEGAGTLVGAPPVIAGRLALTGTGHAAFNLVGSPTLSGAIAARQTLFLAANVTATGPLTNRGTVIVRSTSTLALPSGATLTNAGSIVAASGSNLFARTNIDNRPAGRIAVVGGQFVLDGPVTLANHGTVTVCELSSRGTDMVGAASSILSAGTSGQITNEAGTIANSGTVVAPRGGTFVEGAGTTSGNPIAINGALDLAGTGSSDFVTLGDSGSLAGDISAGQTVWINGSPTHAAASFTNRGTLIGNGILVLPSGGTLTNAGTLEVGHGGIGSRWMDLAGNLINTARGVIGEENGGINMDTDGTTFDNAGTLYMLFSSAYNFFGSGQGDAPRHVTFRTSGTIYLGVDSDTGWGGFGLHSSFGGYPADTVDLGGTIVPVSFGEPGPGSPGGKEITYGLTGLGTLSPGTTKPYYTLLCSARVTEGWSLSCGVRATLIEPRATTLIPTAVSLTGTGTALGPGWHSSYGQTVRLTATVAAQSGGAPTGQVAFYAARQSNVGSAAATRADLLGTASLAPSGPGASAVWTADLPPGQYDLLALYYGDARHLAASTMYDATQFVLPQSTRITLTSSGLSAVFGRAVTFTATVTPGIRGPATPSGYATFFLGSNAIGAVPVSTKNGVTQAQLTTADLLPGANSITAAYSGDDHYAGITSSALTQN